MHYMSGLLKLNKILLAIVVLSLVFAILSPMLLDSPQCTTEVTQQQRDASGCIIGADFGPGFGIIFGIGLAVTVLLLAIILQAPRFKKLSFLAKFFVLLPLGAALLFSLYIVLGLINFILQK